MNYQKLNLADNPFTATPTGVRPIWCGMAALKSRIGTTSGNIFADFTVLARC